MKKMKNIQYRFLSKNLKKKHLKYIISKFFSNIIKKILKPILILI